MIMMIVRVVLVVLGVVGIKNEMVLMIMTKKVLVMITDADVVVVESDYVDRR